MSATSDKRKANRIQGSYMKSGDNKKKQNKDVANNDINCSGVDFNLEFDSTAANDKEQKYKFEDINNDLRVDINLYAENLLSNCKPAVVDYRKNFISSDEAASLMEYFIKHLPWKQRENATITGQKFLEPRETCWFGLPYAYSQIEMPPNSNWDKKLLELRESLQEFSDENKPFNSVMCNLYRGAKNSIDWHADDEKTLGKNPTIASISLGCTRAFEVCLRSELFGKFKKQSKNVYRSRVKEDPPFDECSLLLRFFLEPGSLLIMSGSMQENWLHRVPKEYHDQTPRINFTFRHIIKETE